MHHSIDCYDLISKLRQLIALYFHIPFQLDLPCSMCQLISSFLVAGLPHSVFSLTGYTDRTVEALSPGVALLMDLNATSGKPPRLSHSCPLSFG